MPETKSPLTLTLPDHPRYAIVEKIAQGAFATVFRGRDVELNREVAIKQIHAQYLEDPHQLDRYWQEAQLIANLEHARIISIYDIVRDRGWLILELMMGSIQQVLKGRPIDLTDLRYLLKAVAQGLQFLERNGIIHGDVKPTNILLDKNRQIRLGDFGIARRLSSGEGSVVKGTAKYMAPEVVSDQFGAVGPHSDLYSLGFSAYELMCGQNFESLFPGLNMFGRDRQVAWMMWQSAPDRRLPEIRRVLQNVPDDLAHMVEKLCEKDPAKRYRTADELLQDLDENKGRDKRPTAEETAAAEKAAKQARRKRLMAVAALVVSLSLSVGLALWPSTPPPPPRVPVPKPLEGTLVLVDLPHHLLQIKTAEGQIKDVPIHPQKDKVYLNKQVSDPGQLQEGDPLAFVPLVVDQKLIQSEFWITRATATEKRGLIAAVEPMSRTLTITPDGSVQSLPPILVPSTVPILLNGEKASLDALRKGDRIAAVYVPDKEGLRAESIEAQRMVEVKGQIKDIYLPSSKIKVLLPDSSTKELLVDEKCQILLNGRAVSLKDLSAGDDVSLQHDRSVHRLDAKRVLIVRGTIDNVDVQRRVLVVHQANQPPRSLTLAEDCAIHLADQEPLDFAVLRKDDAVTVVEDPQDGRARSIEAVLAPDRRLWAILIGQSRYDDRRLTPSTVAGPNAELLRQTLLRHARVVADQLLWLPEATRYGVQAATAEFLKRIPAGSRLLVYFAGHAAKSDQGDVYLALRDFDPSRPGLTGQDLAALLKSLDAVTADEKVFLFDVQYGGEDRRWQPAAAELIETLKSRNGSVSQSVLVIANCSRGEVDAAAEGGKLGLFASCTAAALKGKADFDRNQHLTPAELFDFLKIEVAGGARRAGQPQNPVLFAPTPAPKLSPEALKALNDLLNIARTGRKADDDELTSAYDRAAALSPKEPHAQLIYALGILQRSQSKTAQGQFEAVAAKFPDHPDTILAYHALAWLHFRSQDYSRGLERLELAVSRVRDPKAAYAQHLVGFAGQLCAFAHWAVADEKLRPKLSQVYQAVGRLETPTQDKIAPKPQPLDTYNQKLKAVKDDVENRKQQIEKELDPQKKAVLELPLKNLSTYASFDAPLVFKVLEDSFQTLAQGGGGAESPGQRETKPLP